MKKTILTVAVFGAALLLGAADLKSAAKQIRSAQDETALNTTLSEALKQSKTDDEKASLLIDAGERAVTLKLNESAVKLFADAAALPKASGRHKAIAMQKQSWVLRSRLNNKKESVEVLKKLLALNIPGYEYSTNNTIATIIYYYGGKEFKRSEAIPYFEAILKYPNSNGIFYVVRDRIEKKKLAEAREILEKAKAQPNPKPSRDFLFDVANAEGELLCAEGKYDASLEAYGKLDKIKPEKHFLALSLQYSVCKAAKNKAKALEILKEMQKAPGRKKMVDNELKYWEKIK